MEIKDNVYLKMVRDPYEKHKGNTKGKHENKWPKVDLG